jgi:HPt (histidine-containing phosphotransfer) domain-containing protein
MVSHETDFFAVNPLNWLKTMQPHIKPPVEQSKSLYAIDLGFLSQQTMEDRTLEAEILGMFVKQISNLSTIMRSANLEERRRLAHKFKGTARSIGAFYMGEVTEKIEVSPQSVQFIDELSDEISRVLNFIAAINR